MNSRVILLCMALAAGSTGCVTKKTHSEAWTVSFPDLKLGRNEYIQGVDLILTNANITAIRHLPYDWDVQITHVTPIQYLTMHAGHFNDGLTNIHKLDKSVTFRSFTTVGINATVFTDTAGTNYPDSKIYTLKQSNLILKKKMPLPSRFGW